MPDISVVNLAAASTVGGGDPQMTQMIASGLQLIHVLQVYTSSMTALAVWDWLVCAKLEWNRVWKREWSIVKCLYLWTRYYGMACFAVNLWLFNAEFTIEQCKTLHYLIAATCMWVTLGSEAILAIRTYAFLGKQLWVGILMVVMLLAETAFLFYVAIAAVYQIPPIIGNKGPCTASDKPGKHVVSGFWLAPVAFDLICTILSVGKALLLRGAGVRSDIVTIFIREGLFYFLAVAAVNVLNAAFMIQSSTPNLQNINCYLALVLSQILCCRLVLNLRSPNEKSLIGTTSESHASFNVSASRSTPNYSIPLKCRGTVETKSNDVHSDAGFEGVKVQIDVERDVERREKV